MTNPPEWVELNRDRCEAIAAAVYRGACTTAHTHQRALAVSLRIAAEQRDVGVTLPGCEEVVRITRHIPRALYEELTSELTDEAFASTH